MRYSDQCFNTVCVKDISITKWFRLTNLPSPQTVCLPLVFLSQPLLLALVGDNWKCSSPASCLAHHIVARCCLSRIIELFTLRNFVHKHLKHSYDRWGPIGGGGGE